LSAPDQKSHREASYYQVRETRRRRWPWVLGATIWLAAGVGLGSVLSAAKQANDLTAIVAAAPEVRKASTKVLTPIKTGEPQTILVIGSDKRAGKEAKGDPGRSDSLMLVRIDSENESISTLSFPRDLYVNIPGYGYDKINAAFSRPGADGGANLTAKTVSELTGQEINDWVNVDFQGFVSLVNLLGGVYIDVDRKYFHVNAPGACPGSDNCYDELDLKPGYQRLNGTDALDYARFRHLDSDRSRIARQQIFLSEVKKQFKKGGTGNLFNLGRFKRDVFPNFETTIRSPQRFLDLIQTAAAVPNERTHRDFIRGRNSATAAGASIVTWTEQEIQSKVDEWLSPKFEKSTSRAKAISPSGVRIAVFNGSGKVLAAEQAAFDLQERGYDAYSVGNASTPAGAPSQIYYAPDRRSAARQVQTAITGSRIAARIRSQVTPLTRDSDLILVVGAYQGLAVPPAKQRTSKEVADVVPTLSLAPTMRSVQAASTSLRVLTPTVVARESRVRIVRPYPIERGGKRFPALKVVFEAGDRHYWSIQQMRWRTPPILDGATGVFKPNQLPKGCRISGVSSYYDGKSLQRLLWQRGEMTYWISNGLPGDLDYPLSAETMKAIACSMQPSGSAALPKGVIGTTMSVEVDGRTG
jgi:LCP family protein required for cell wall assembly